MIHRLCQFDCSPKSSCDSQPLDQFSLPWPLPFSHCSLRQGLSGSSDLRNWKFSLFHLQSVPWCTCVWSVQFSCSVVSNSLRPHESQHARPPCPSPSPVISHVQLFATPWTVTHQAPLSMGFPGQEYQSGYLPFPSPGDRPKPEIESHPGDSLSKNKAAHFLCLSWNASGLAYHPPPLEIRLCWSRNMFCSKLYQYGQLIVILYTHLISKACSFFLVFKLKSVLTLHST